MNSRLCRGCGVTRPIGDFAFKNATFWKAPLTLRRMVSARVEAALPDKKGAYLEHNRRNNPLQRQAIRIFVTQLLLNHACAECGKRDPVVLEFNHLDPAMETANVCDMIHFRVSVARIHREIARCEGFVRELSRAPHDESAPGTLQAGIWRKWSDGNLRARVWQRTDTTSSSCCSASGKRRALTAALRIRFCFSSIICGRRRKTSPRL
jgi:hypothetical protein